MDVYTWNEIICKNLILLDMFINVSNWCVNVDFVMPLSHIQLAEILLRPTISTEVAARSPGDPGERSLDVLARKSVAAIFFNMIKRVFATDFMADSSPPIYDEFG